MAIALGVMAGLAAALWLVGGPGTTTASTITLHTTTGADPAPQLVPRSPGGTTTRARAPVTAGVPAGGEIVADVEAALTAWGRFAVSGDLAVVGESFAVDGPQYAQLASEAPDLLVAPPGPPPYVFGLTDPTLVIAARERAVVRGTVTVSRPGVAAGSYRWDMELRPDEASGRWRLWTVSTVR